MLESLLAIVDGSEGSYPSVDAAIDLVRYHRAHLELSVLFEQVPVIAATDAGGYALALNASNDLPREELSVIRDKVAKAELGIALNNVCVDPAEFPRLACCWGQYVDLALIGPATGWNSAKNRRRIIEALILQAGTPTLLHQQGWEPSLFRHAVLGWNGSPEASRAARALIAVLEPGASIDVLMVDETDKTDCDGGELCQSIGNHLSRHGFAVDLHTRSSTGRSAADVLQGFARMREAQLLAIGSYTHSPLREGLFGGVTRELIDAPRVPVLMVH